MVESTIAVGSTLHVITRYDHASRQFTTRNVVTEATGPIDASTLAKAIEDGICTVIDHRALQERRRDRRARRA